MRLPKHQAARQLALGAGALLLVSHASAQSSCAPRRADTGHVAFTGVTLWDGTDGPARLRTTILVHGERIAAVFADDSTPLPPATIVHAMRGKYVIPGLIDAHVHIATDPSGEDTRERTERRLCRALLGGVTAVRDMAGDVRALASLQRDARVSDIASPDIYYAALWAGPAFFADPRTAAASAGATPGTLPWMRAIDSATNLPQAMAEARGTGAAAIKLYAALTPDQVAAITVEARRQGLPVWAHAAMGQVSPSQTVGAGVDVVSHASLILRELGREEYTALMEAPAKDAQARLVDARFDALFLAMRQRGTIYEPTLFVYRGERARALDLAVAITRRAHRAGVPLLAGTDSLGSGDAGAWEAPNIHAELESLVRDVGLSPRDALLAATRTGAGAIGAAGERGTVEEGKVADLVILDGDPLAAIGNTRTLHRVVKRGAVYIAGQ